MEVGGGQYDEAVGRVTFLPLNLDTRVEIEPGYQGLQHIWVIARLQTNRPEGVQAEYTVYLTETGKRLGGGSQKADLTVPLDVQAANEGWMDMPAFPAVVLDPEQVDGRRVDITVLVGDSCQRETTESRNVTAEWIPREP